MTSFRKFILPSLFFLSILGVAQEMQIDSLKSALSLKVTKEEKVELFALISEQYFDNQIYLDSSYFYAERAYDLSRELQDDYHRGRALFNLALVDTEFRNFDQALERFSACKEIVEKQGKPIMVSIILSNIGGLYLEKGVYPLAVENYTKAIEISQAQKDTLGVAIDYINLGETHFKAGNFEQSKNDLEYCLNLLDELGETYASAHLNYGKTMHALADKQTAKMHALKAYEVSKGDNNLKGILGSTEFLSLLFREERNFKEALSYLKEFHDQKELLNEAKELNEVEKLKLNLALSKKEAELDRASQRDAYKAIIYILGGLGLLLLGLLVSRQLRIYHMKTQIHEQQASLLNSETELLSKKKRMFKAFYSGKETD